MKTKNIQTYHLSIFELHFSPPEFTKSTNKFYRIDRPREIVKALTKIVFLSPRSKTGQDPCKNKYGQNCIAQVVCWYSAWLNGAAGVAQLVVK